MASPPSRRKPLLGPGTRLAALHVLNDGFAASLPLLLPFAREELGLSLSGVGALGGLLGAAGVVLAFPAAWLAGRFGGPRILRWALGAYGLAFVLAGLAPGFAVLAAAFLLASLGFGLFHPVAFSLVASSGGGAKVGKRMGDFTAVGDFGRLGLAAAATAVAAALGWRGTALAYGALPLALFAVSIVLARRAESPNAPVEAGEAAPAGRSGGRARGRMGPFATVLAAVALDGMAGSAIFMFLPFLMADRGMPPALLGSLTGAFFVGTLLGKTLLGRLGDRFGNRAVFLGSELAMAALLAVLAALRSGPAIAAVSVVLGAVTKGTVPVLNSMIAERSPREGLGAAFGASSFAAGAAATVAPLAYGLLADARGIDAVFLACAAFAVAAMVPILAAAPGRPRRD